MNTRSARVVRGLCAAVIATFVAAISHSLGGGEFASIQVLAIALTFSAGACIALTARTLSLWRTVIAVFLSQFPYHLLFSGHSSVNARSVHGEPMSMPGMQHASEIQPETVQVATATMSPASMWFAHSVAAILTIVALRLGEKALWRMIELATIVVRAITAIVLVPVQTVNSALTAVVADRTLLPAELGILISSLRHRGPPAMSSIA